MGCMMQFMDTMTQAGLFPADPATSQVGGGAQTPTSQAPGHVATVYHTLGALPDGGAQTVAAAAPEPRPTADGDTQKLLDRCTRLHPPVLGAEHHEDAQDFIDRARRWWQSYLLGRPAGSPPMTWSQFTQLFLDRYTPPSEREELWYQFEQLEQGQILVTDYEARFFELSHHALMILPTDVERVQRFIAGLHSGIRANMAREVEIGTSYQLVVEITRRIEGYHQKEREREQTQQGKRAHFSREFRGAPARGRGSDIRAAYRHTEGLFRVQRSRSHKEILPQVSGQGSAVGPAAHDFSTDYLPPRGGGQASRDRPRGGGQAWGGQSTTIQSGGGQPAGAPAKFYASPARPDALASDVMITSIISVDGRYASVLFDPGSTYSYVSSLFAHFLDNPRDSLGNPLYVSTLVGDSMIVDQIYRSCVVIFCGYETRADLLLLDMIDFEVILGMVWLSPYHDVLDCHYKTITLAMPELSRLD
ncbi:uncharacterized protein [Nicotiana tomentosiformis]|uniref:uncharacterized protein n=1 Tax=Nicotiana tomentosiformis TaxID=4098 RepID=UPI00388CB6AD